MKVSPTSDGRKVTPHARLMTAWKPGGYMVMGFERMGMTSAQPRFIDGQLIAPYSDFVERVDHNGYGKLVHPDALLIAAAPELYEALERQIGRCGCGGTGKIPYEVNVVLDCTDPDCIAARAALAKARGE